MFMLTSPTCVLICTTPKEQPNWSPFTYHPGGCGESGEGQRAPVRRHPARADGRLPATAARDQEEGGEGLLLRDDGVEEERPGSLRSLMPLPVF